MLKPVKKIVYHLKLIAWLIIISILCFTPGNELKKVHISIPHFDKMVHFIMFFALAFFIKALLWKDVISNRVFQTYLLLGVIYAALIEVIQYNWIFMRSGDWVDWLFDMAGMGVSLWIFKYWPNPLKRIFG